VSSGVAAVEPPLDHMIGGQPSIMQAFGIAIQLVAQDVSHASLLS
jgi:hypothetical protein